MSGGTCYAPVMDLQKPTPSPDMDDLFGSASDCHVIVGVSYLPNNKRLAVARVVIYEDGDPRPWPKKLVCRQAFEVGTNQNLFVIYEPPDGLPLPWVAVEWNDACEEFTEVAKADGRFLVEFYRPADRRQAIVQLSDDSVHPGPIKPLDREAFEAVATGMFENTKAVNSRNGGVG